jgi:hypothetical protein
VRATGQGVDENYILRMGFKDIPGMTQASDRSTDHRMFLKTLYFRRNRKFVRNML